MFFSQLFVSDNHEKYTYLETLSFECFAGYKLANGKHLYDVTCEADGKFTKMPDCLPVSCPEIKKVDNGNASNFTGFYMDKIEFTCNDGLVIFLTIVVLVFLF